MYNCLDTQTDSGDVKPGGNRQPLPVGDSAPQEPVKTPSQPSVPAASKQEIAAALQQQNGGPEIPKERKPLRVEIVKDDELSAFEKKTVIYTIIGIFISFLAFIAACVAIVFVYQQFKEMADQTDILNRQARQARSDSAAASLVTDKQLSIAQQRATAAQNQVAAVTRQMRVDQRPLVKPDRQLQNVTLTVGQPVTLPIQFSNIGKTPAWQGK